MWKETNFEEKKLLETAPLRRVVVAVALVAHVKLKTRTICDKKNFVGQNWWNLEKFKIFKIGQNLENLKSLTLAEIKIWDP